MNSIDKEYPGTFRSIEQEDPRVFIVYLMTNI